jgi:O-antigen/teichoic acid export membrane protein
VGIYQAAVQVSIILDVIVGTFNTVFASRISRLHFASDTARLDELFKISTKWAFYTSMPAFLVLCCSAHELLRISYGPAYGGGAVPLIILSLGSMADAASGAAGYLLAFTGFQKRLTAISGVTLVVAIFLNYLLIPRFGLIGAAVATAFAHAGVCLAFLITVHRCLGVWPYDRRWLKGLLAGALTCAIVLLARPLAANSDLGQFLLTLGISVGVFPAALFVLGLDPEDKEFVRMIRMRFSSDRIAKSSSH